MELYINVLMLHRRRLNRYFTTDLRGYLFRQRINTTYWEMCLATKHPKDNRRQHTDNKHKLIFFMLFRSLVSMFSFVRASVCLVFDDGSVDAFT